MFQSAHPIKVSAKLERRDTHVVAEQNLCRIRTVYARNQSTLGRARSNGEAWIWVIGAQYKLVLSVEEVKDVDGGAVGDSITAVAAVQAVLSAANITGCQLGLRD